ncbi:MAG: MFS transporter [Spirochaetota bacterium]|nr:MAG: MFS transporter [Spirochaetota bacterium]
MQKKKLILIGAMHFALDAYMGFFAIYLVIARLDPFKAALISTATFFIGNMLQPFMGYTADRLRGKVPLFMGLILASVFNSLIGITINYTLLFLFMFLGIVGSSFFHPAGANVAGAAFERKKDTSVAIFTTLGTIGFALSQPIFSLFAGRYGTQASVLLCIPAVIIAGSYLVFSKVEIHGQEEKVKLKELKTILVQRFVPIIMLFLIMVFRSTFIFSMNLFLAKTLEQWGFQRHLYAMANTVFMLSGAIGILCVGYLASFIRPSKLLFLSQVGFLPFFLIFVYYGRAGNVLYTFIFLALTGFIINSGHAANIVMGHRITPELTSTISGVLIGFAWGVSSFGPTLCALLQSSISILPGMASGLVILSLFPITAAVLTLFLTREVDGQ